MTEEPPFQFEKAFSRLEEILATMNEGQAGLDDALKLYEEADKLISACTNRLNEAENRIESLIKQRTGVIATDDTGTPMVQPFTPPNGG